MHRKLTQQRAERLDSNQPGGERQLLSESGIFDVAGYVNRAGSQADIDPLSHYLQIGWKKGFEPNEAFPGNCLRPYFAALGISEVPAITWLVLRSAGWPMPHSQNELLRWAEAVRHTGLFDEDFYRSQLDCESASLDPAIHYVTVGERLGIAPSERFDPAYYGVVNPDVTASGVSYLLHYSEFGSKERRLPKAPTVCAAGDARSDPLRENVLLVVHEASRTGAPILGWNIATRLAQRYNIYTIAMLQGELTADFKKLSVEIWGPFPWPNRTRSEIEFSLRRLLAVRPYRYAIVNSAESRAVVEPFVRQFIPTLFSLHEFSSYVSPLSQLTSALDWCTVPIFSAPLVQKSALAAHPNLGARTTHVLPQGVVSLPVQAHSQTSKTTLRPEVASLTSRGRSNNEFVVLGAGQVILRKGVDVFLSTAASVLRKHPRRKFHFLWLGDGYRPKEDVSYSVYLQEQLVRAQLTEHVTFLDSVENLEPIYEAVDAFLLTSRLDPLPNVTIDAAVRGIPVVCFREATGMADLMLGDPLTAIGVVDYLDTDAAAEILTKLGDDEHLRRDLSQAMIALAHRHFDMQEYVRRLDELGIQASSVMQQRRTDFQTLLSDATFDESMFLRPFDSMADRAAAATQYLALSAARGWRSLPAPDAVLRRPAPGFHPRVYGAAHAHRLTGSEDPFADYIRHGKPAGPWQSNVLRADDATPSSSPQRELRVALHAHVFYPELCDDLLSRLRDNRTRCDLFLTTDTDGKAATIRKTFSDYDAGEVEVTVVPNRGRDIGPLLTSIAPRCSDYDLLGHVHTKRSKWTNGRPADTEWGEQWREFLWQNLLGGLHPMMDRIVAAFQHDESLGLVFPSDPHLVDWGENREIATRLAARFGWPGDLPDEFDFPLGNMFWLRPAAIRPLLDLRLTWDDYPLEPVPYDGTILHALERLLPFACQVSGHRCAVTHVASISWSPSVS